MNKLTAGFIVFLVAALVFATVFVSLSPDFVPPEEKKAEGGLDEAIWEMKLDDLVTYLVEKGLINDVQDYGLLSAGIATDARLYNCGVELYWWDLENLSDDDPLMECYNTANEEGYVMFAGIPLSMQIHGPFGLGYMANYEGDAEALVTAFNNYFVVGAETQENAFSEDHPIWSKTPDDFAQYLVEQGIIDSVEDYQPLSEGLATNARLYNAGFEIYWWDKDNLVPDSDEEKNFITGTEEGYITAYGTYIFAVDMNGPFALGYYANYEGDVEKLFEVFHAYCADAQ